MTSSSELQEKVRELQREVVTLEGKVANRDPKRIAKVKEENQKLTERFALLKKALFAIMAESYQPRTADEAKLQYETLRKSAVEYCKKAKVDPEIWKSIAS